MSYWIIGTLAALFAIGVAVQRYRYRKLLFDLRAELAEERTQGEGLRLVIALAPWAHIEPPKIPEQRTVLVPGWANPRRRGR